MEGKGKRKVKGERRKVTGVTTKERDGWGRGKGREGNGQVGKGVGREGSG